MVKGIGSQCHASFLVLKGKHIHLQKNRCPLVHNAFLALLSVFGGPRRASSSIILKQFRKKIPESSRTKYSGIPEICRNIPEFRKCTGIFRNIPEFRKYTGIFRNSAGLNIPVFRKYSGIFRFRYSGLFRNILDGDITPHVALWLTPLLGAGCRPLLPSRPFQIGA